MASKPKTPQKEDLVGVSLRDQFQTPNYAVDLLLPFLPFSTTDRKMIWECAAGLEKIAFRLKSAGYDAIWTDLAYNGTTKMNFLTEKASFHFDCIITNPPFSLKRKFYERCIWYGVPFALLIPADYTGWVIEAIDKHGCEKIIPTRRIDYITPNILQRIHEGEIWENSKEFYPDTKSLNQFKQECPDIWKGELDTFAGYCLWDSIYDAPPALLRKYSSSYYHSMWLTWGFGIGRTETFVELTNEEKNNI